MSLAKMIASPDAPPLEATFPVKLATDAGNVELDVTLRYLPEAQQGREIAPRVVGSMSGGGGGDIVTALAELDEAATEVLATQVVRIDKATACGMALLFGIGDEVVARAGGADAAVALDPGDATPLSEEERRIWGWGDRVMTKGHAAAANIRALLRRCPALREAIVAIVVDVSRFQTFADA